MRRLIVLQSAAENLEDIQSFIAVENPARAVTFTDELVQQCEHLATLPGTLGRSRPELRPDLRSYAYRGYLIFFRYKPGVFEVVNIIEGHRDIDSMILR